MKLDPMQLASLQRLRKYRDAAPTERERIRLAFRIALVLLIPFGICGALFLWLGARSTLFLLVGLYLGVVAREIGAQRTFVRWWKP
jgi:hypothetical protein